MSFLRCNRPVLFGPRVLLIITSFLTTITTQEPAFSQGTQADYARADAFAGRMQGKVLRDRVEPQWFADGSKFWYRVDLGAGAREFVLVDTEAGTRSPAFDHPRLARALTDRLGRDFEADRLPIHRIVVSDDARLVGFATQGLNWIHDREKERLSIIGIHLAEPNRRQRPGATTDSRSWPSRGRQRRDDVSPDGRYRALVRNHNLLLRDLESEEEFPLTTDGKDGDAYQGRFYWSPDSSRLIALKTKAGTDRTVHLIESAPRDQLQPKLLSYSYRKPGDEIPLTRPYLFDIEKREEIEVSNEHFSNPWSINQFRWEEDSSRFLFQYNERGHQVLRIVAIQAKDGTTSAVIDEVSPTFLDYAHKNYLRHLEDTEEIIWMSERSGWNHLYLIDAQTGAVKNPITKGDWVVRAVDRIDEEARQVWFQVMGIHSDQDPYHNHFARVNFDGTDLTLLTEGDGTHEVDFSPDRRFYLDRYSRVDLPPITELRRSYDGSLVCKLEKADWSALLETGWQVPERFVSKGRDGETDIYGVIFRPTTFDPDQQYPVVEQIYAGPQGAFVPKAFRSQHGPQSLAELGFIVLQIDGMGTNWRSKAFHDVCWKNLADSGFPDRIPWIKAAAAQYPYMDLSRGVGIYGGSAGGQSALRALLAHGDFYTVAVADCGCHDNRMDKIWWNELWMSWPIGSHYEEQSNVTNAHKFTGKLLLIVGELDRNVDPASTMQVVDALVRADKDFDLLVIPGAGHGAAGNSYGRRRQRDFLVRHLLGVEPRR